MQDEPILTEQELLALGVLLGGLASTLGVYFFATGRTREAAMIGVATGVTGAFISAARFLRPAPRGDVVIESSRVVPPLQPWSNLGI